MQRKIATLIMPMLALTLGVAGPARAGLVNGSFEQFTGGYNGLPSQLGTTDTGGYTALTGWTLGSSTYGFLINPAIADSKTTGTYSPQFNNLFTLWGANNGGLMTLPASPDKGYYLALDAADSYHGTGISQTLTGLTAGNRYAVTFDWASGQQHGYDGMTTEGLQVSFGKNQMQATSTVTNVSHGFTPWQQQTFVFTADGTSDVLNFLAVGSPNGLPPMVLLDGVSFSAVPEPGSLALVGIGLLVTATAHRCRKGKTVPVGS